MKLETPRKERHMGILDSIRTLTELNKELASIEAKRALAEVIDDLISAQTRIAELECEVRQLRTQIQFTAEVVHKDNAVWTKSGEGPFCSRCVTVTGKPVRLIIRNDGYRRCPECKDEPQTEEWERRADAAARTRQERVRRELE